MASSWLYYRVFVGQGLTCTTGTNRLYGSNTYAGTGTLNQCFDLCEQTYPTSTHVDYYPADGWCNCYLHTCGAACPSRLMIQTHSNQAFVVFQRVPNGLDTSGALGTESATCS